MQVGTVGIENEPDQILRIKRGCQVCSAHGRVLFTFLFQTIDNYTGL
jgi:hypothetical protein